MDSFTDPIYVDPKGKASYKPPPARRRAPTTRKKVTVSKPSDNTYRIQTTQHTYYHRDPNPAPMGMGRLYDIQHKEMESRTAPDKAAASKIGSLFSGAFSSWGRSLTTIGVMVFLVMVIYMLVSQGGKGAKNLFSDLSAMTAPTGKILSSKPMFKKGSSKVFAHA